MTGIDLNRAGTPLLEIVSEPDIRSPDEAVAYLKKLHTLVRYLDISDGNMQEGSFRCDANVSIRPRGETTLGTRTEMKNINSFRFVERAIEYEVERQIDLLEDGGSVVQETRLYDSDKHETRSMRSKEEAHDYRYFPDPDLPPMVLSQEFVEAIRSTLPELPDDRCERFTSEYGLGTDDAAQLTATREVADYYEKVVAGSSGSPGVVANWVTGELFAGLNREDLDITDTPVDATQMATLVSRIHDNTLSGNTAKQVFSALWAGETDVDKIIDARGLKQITDTGAIDAIIDGVLTECSSQVQQYKEGNEKVFGFLVGQVMKASGGKANPQQVNKLLKSRLRA
jgi:aspartyl-tRNA(Asn)/glutamyl-tRNA(Gln) amidotransferase subunit B